MSELLTWCPNLWHITLPFEDSLIVDHLLLGLVVSVVLEQPLRLRVHMPATQRLHDGQWTSDMNRQFHQIHQIKCITGAGLKINTVFLMIQISIFFQIQFCCLILSINKDTLHA